MQIPPLPNPTSLFLSSTPNLINRTEEDRSHCLSEQLIRSPFATRSLAPNSRQSLLSGRESRNNHPTSSQTFSTVKVFLDSDLPSLVQAKTPSPKVNMCDYTQVEFRCGHVRYTVRAWCTNYETTHKRCPPSVVAIEFR